MCCFIVFIEIRGGARLLGNQQLVCLCFQDGGEGFH